MPQQIHAWHSGSLLQQHMVEEMPAEAAKLASSSANND
jgi:hypothetical protein